MKNNRVTAQRLEAFRAHLGREGRSPGTVEKYLRDTRAFARWLAGEPVTQERVVAWREALLAGGYAPVTVNSMLAALHSFFRFAGWQELRVKFLRVQRRTFREEARELTRAEYTRLRQTARARGRERLALVLETIGATGIRVSEVKYITVEAARQRRAEVYLKGKVRTILLPGKLCKKLLGYAKAQKITSGQVFRTRGGGSLSRKQIWAEMKALSRQAGVEPSKVFPHNLRHLFARCFYQASRDLVKLADVLGHNAVETTRIYLVTTGREHARTLENLGLMG